MELISNNVEQTKKIGYDFAKSLDTGGHKSVFIAMHGEMGVGKTAFTSGFASYFGISTIKSPTYSVMNQHTSPSGIRIYHFDMYRIADEDDLYSIGYDDYRDAQGYKIVEWSENIEGEIPSDAVFVTIERCEASPEMRKITIQGGIWDENSCP